jgi:hypothetical protein
MLIQVHYIVLEEIALNIGKNKCHKKILVTKSQFIN